MVEDDKNVINHSLVLAGAVAVVLALILAAWPIMWFWNFAIVAAVSVAQPIGYWVAFCMGLVAFLYQWFRNLKGD